MILRLVHHKPQVASLTEIRERWSMADVFASNDLLDLEDEQRLRSAEIAKEQRDMLELQRSLRVK